VHRDRERKKERERERNGQFATPLQMRCTSIEVMRNFWLSYRQYSRYHVTVCQGNTSTPRSIGRHKCADLGKYRFQITHWKSIILNFLAKFSVSNCYYFTITSFLTLSVYSMLNNARDPKSTGCIQKFRYPLPV
jgi:hypothetical protein